MQNIKEKMLPKMLRDLRIKLHLSQKDIAKELEMSSTMYCRIESGERILQDYQLLKLASIFKVKIEDLRALNLADKIREESKKYSIAEVQVALATVNSKLEQKEW